MDNIQPQPDKAIQFVPPNHVEVIKGEIAKLNITDTVIEELAKEYLPLKISDLNDKDGAVKVHQARMDIVRKRNLVENKRKELKADALEYGRLVDKEAKRVIDMMAPIEAHLDKEEEKIRLEKERIQKEKEEQERLVLQQRAMVLLSFGATFDSYNYILTDLRISLPELKAATDNEFVVISKQWAQKAEEIEATRKQAEEAKLKLEQEQRIERERIAEEQRIEREHIAEEQRIERERLEAVQKEQAEKEAALRQEAAARQAELDKKEAELKAHDEEIKRKEKEIEAANVAAEITSQVTTPNNNIVDGQQILVILGKIQSLLDQEHNFSSDDTSNLYSEIKEEMIAIINKYATKLI